MVGRKAACYSSPPCITIITLGVISSLFAFAEGAPPKSVRECCFKSTYQCHHLDHVFIQALPPCLNVTSGVKIHDEVLNECALLFPSIEIGLLKRVLPADNECGASQSHADKFQPDRAAHVHKSKTLDQGTDTGVIVYTQRSKLSLELGYRW